MRSLRNKHKPWLEQCFDERNTGYLWTIWSQTGTTTPDQKLTSNSSLTLNKLSCRLRQKISTVHAFSSTRKLMIWSHSGKTWQSCHRSRNTCWSTRFKKCMRWKNSYRHAKKCRLKAKTRWSPKFSNNSKTGFSVSLAIHLTNWQSGMTSWQPECSISTVTRWFLDEMPLTNMLKN